MDRKGRDTINKQAKSLNIGHSEQHIEFSLEAVFLYIVFKIARPHVYLHFICI